MYTSHESLFQLLRLAIRPVFLLIDLLGVGCLLFAVLLDEPWKGALSTIGSACLTIGVSLPVALFFQLRSNAETLRLLDACSRSGIRAIFQSRQADKLGFRFAIDEAISRSSKVDLLGIAFRDFFDPSNEYTRQVIEKLRSPTIQFRVLVLDPSDHAAKHRAKIEQNGKTISDIVSTLEYGIPAMLQARIHKLKAEDLELRDQIEAAGNKWTPELGKAIADRCKFQVKTYKFDPITFLMVFEDSLFAEQYHFGHPDDHPIAACIGKQIPIIEYATNSKAARYLKAHYEEVWQVGTDITIELIRKAVRRETEGANSSDDVNASSLVPQLN